MIYGLATNVEMTRADEVPRAELSTVPLLDFRCVTAHSIYLEGDLTNTSLIFDGLSQDRFA